MIVLKKPISRRSFVRGAGVAVSLPFLGAMLPSSSNAADAATSPRRVGFVYVPQGMVMTDTEDWWTPSTSGRVFEFSRTLMPLEKHRKHVTVISNLVGAEGAGQHSGAASAWLTDSFPGDNDEVRAGISIDQLIAKQGRPTPVASMQLATEDLGSLVGLWHTGYSCAYLNALSWSSPTDSLPGITQPRAVFERMFSAEASAGQRAARLRTRRSILDTVADDTNRLSRRLGASDRARMKDYLENVREVEQRIGAREGAVARAEEGTTAVSASEHIRIMYDLLSLAYQSDMTRVSTFMVAREVSQLSYPEIGVIEPHHALSHHQNAPEAMARLGNVNRHHVRLFAEFVDKLAAAPEGDGSVLDHTLLVYGSGMSNGNDHTKSKLPVALVSGFVRGNRHIVLARETPIGDLHVDVAKQMGLELRAFGERSKGATVGLS